MKVLLDTHAFIWWDSAPDKLSEVARLLCHDASHDLLLSVVTVWEMQIKRQLGKLQMRRPLAEVIADQQSTNRFQILPISLEHVLAVEALPMHHRDPFDRMLMAQAITENAVLVSHDAVFVQYPVRTYW